MEMTHKIEDTARELGERVRPQIEDAKRRLSSLNETVTGYIKENPGKCVLGADRARLPHRQDRQSLTRRKGGTPWNRSSRIRRTDRRRLDEAGRTLGRARRSGRPHGRAGLDRTRDTVSDLRGAVDLEGRVDRHPYGTVAAAIGIGYVLGGGLFSPLTARIVRLGLRIGLRLAVLPLLKDELFGIWSRALDGGDGEGESAE